MTIKTLYFLQCAILAVSIVSFVIFVILYMKKTDIRRKFRIPVLCSSLLLIASSILGIFMTSLTRTGAAHGMYRNDHTVAQAMHYINRTPVEDKLPEDITDTLVLYYRFDCEACHDVYDELKTEVARFEERTGAKIYWVSTRSVQGEKLRETYTVKQVPSLLYIRSSQPGNPFYIEAVTMKEGETYKFYAPAWDKIMEIRDQYTKGTKFANT